MEDWEGFSDNKCLRAVLIPGYMIKLLWVGWENLQLLYHFLPKIYLYQTDVAFHSWKNGKTWVYWVKLHAADSRATVGEVIFKFKLVIDMLQQFEFSLSSNCDEIKLAFKVWLGDRINSQINKIILYLGIDNLDSFV